jgi:hypothetical protein
LALSARLTAMSITRMTFGERTHRQGGARSRWNDAARGAIGPGCHSGSHSDQPHVVAESPTLQATDSVRSRWSAASRPGYEADAAFSELNMLALPGGRERTEEEYAALLAAADLQLTRVVHTSSRVSILEARPPHYEVNRPLTSSAP